MIHIFSRFSDFSLSVRVTTIVLTMVVILAGGAIYFIEQREQHELLTDLGTRLNDRARFADQEFRDDIESLRQSVLFLSRTPPIQSIIHTEKDPVASTVWKKRLLAIFKAFAETHPFYYQIRYIGVKDQGLELVRVDRTDGKVVATSSQDLQHKSHRDYFQDTLSYRAGEVYLSEINLNREHKKIQVPHVRTLRASTPVYDEKSGRLFGMIVINVDIGSFIDKLNFDIPEEAQTYLLNSDGDYLYHPVARKAFGFDLGQRYRWLDEYDESPLVNNKLSKNNALQRMTSLIGDFFIASAAIHLDPEKPEKFLTVVYAMSEGEINKLVAHKRIVIIVSLLSIALFISVTLFMVLRRLFLPLTHLTETAQKLGEGSIEIKLPYVTQGEIGAFVKAFNQMLFRIRRREEEIITLNLELARREDFLNKIIETVPEAILVVDQNGRIIKINQRVGRLFGYTLKQLQGQSIEILMPESLRNRHVAFRKEYYENAEPRMMGQGRDLDGLRSDGSVFPLEIGMAPMWMEGDMFVIVSMVDITERKRMERALKTTQEEFFRLITSNVKDYAIIMLDPEGRVLTWNEGAERIEGYKAKEILGRSAEIFYLQKDVEAGTFSKLLEIAKETGHYEGCGWRLRQDGSRFYTDLVITAMRDDEGNLIGFTKIDHDITERRKIQEELKLLNSDLENRVHERTAELAMANRELDSFAYAVSHDLRAPLRAMMGFSEALIEDFGGQIPDEAQEYLSEISKASENMSELVDGLLALSRNTRGELHKNRFDISALAEEICQELILQGEGINAEYEIEPGLMVEGDIRTLKIVLRNLLSNAFKYSADQEYPHVRFFHEQRSDGLVYCVSDNGAGFDMAHSDRMFKPFQRLHRQDEFPGIGIGLATVQRIIHRHGGEIYAFSSPGQGAEFYFTLPSNSEITESDEKDIIG